MFHLLFRSHSISTFLIMSAKFLAFPVIVPTFPGTRPYSQSASLALFLLFLPTDSLPPTNSRPVFTSTQLITPMAVGVNRIGFILVISIVNLSYILKRCSSCHSPIQGWDGTVRTAAGSFISLIAHSFKVEQLIPILKQGSTVLFIFWLSLSFNWIIKHDTGTLKY